MIIKYRDEMGIVAVEVDCDGVSFSDGFAFFCDGQTDYKINTDAVESING